MKKILAAVISLCMSFSLFASEEAEVKKVLDDFFACVNSMDGSGLLKLLHPEYVDEDDSGKSSYADMKAACGEMDKMRLVFDRALVPGATLMDVMTACFAIDGTDLDAESKNAIRTLENTAEGRKLKDESLKALQEMKKISQQKTADELASCRIISLQVNGDDARMQFVTNVEGKNENNLWILVKYQGKWCLKKSISSFTRNLDHE